MTVELLYLGNNMVTTDMKGQIYYAANAPAMKTHIQDYLKLTSETVEETIGELLDEQRRDSSYTSLFGQRK